MSACAGGELESALSTTTDYTFDSASLRAAATTSRARTRMSRPTRMNVAQELKT